MTALFDHTMVQVTDLERTRTWYQNLLDYELETTFETDQFRAVYLVPSGAGKEAARLGLIEYSDSDTVEPGDAWGHIAVSVRDVETAYYELMDGGVKDYRPPENNPGYAFVRDPDGREVEIVERSRGTRWHIDHTMIRVTDATQALGYWVRTFEFESAGRWEADTFANYFLAPPVDAPEAMTVELTYNYDGRSYTAGNAWQHLGVRVDDLADAWDQLLVRESASVQAPDETNSTYALTADSDDHPIALVESSDATVPMRVD